jgi:small subunit ribosomal protein S16
MLKIRLRKPGKSASGRFHSKIVVIEHGRAREGKFIEQVGFYDPKLQILKFDIPIFEKWVKVGAKPSETVASLLKRYKETLAGKVSKAKKPKRKGKKEEKPA